MTNPDRDNRGKFVEGSEAARKAGQKGGKQNGQRDNAARQAAIDTTDLEE